MHINCIEMSPTNHDKDADCHFAASFVAAVINFPLWRASAIAQSGNIHYHFDDCQYHFDHYQYHIMLYITNHNIKKVSN